MKKGFIPEQCALWKKQVIEESDVRDAFDLVETYIDTSHLWRYLLRCKECGQLYFFEFYEEVNWAGKGNGNDYQYSTWIPVAPGVAETLKDKSPLKLLDPELVPRIQADLTPDGEHPIHWVR